VAVLGGEAVGVLVHVQRAHQHRAGGLQALHSTASAVAGRASRSIFEPASVVRPATSNRFFTAKGTPSSGSACGRGAAGQSTLERGGFGARSASRR
jgi:hypothetical protein